MEIPYLTGSQITRAKEWIKNGQQPPIPYFLEDGKLAVVLEMIAQETKPEPYGKIIRAVKKQGSRKKNK